MSIQAMKHALKALEEVNSWESATRWNGCFDEEITSLRQAIAEAEKHEVSQEPDYWLGYGLQAHTEKPFEDATPVYMRPQPAHPKREPLTDEQPMRWAVFCGICRKEWSVPYQHPGKSVCDDCVAAHGIKEENNATSPSATGAT